MNNPDPQEPDESPEAEFPLGIKWYAQDWEDANFWLPRGHMMPVQVKLASGKMEIWMSVTRDWRPVRAWRKIRVTNGCAKRLRREQKVEAQDLELA
jgi:hypothetical protein